MNTSKPYDLTPIQGGFLCDGGAERRFLLDTHVVWWLFIGDERLPKQLKEQIDGYWDVFAVSYDVMRELVAMRHSKKKEKIEMTLDEIYKKLEEHNIAITAFGKKDSYVLDELPFVKDHSDPADRAIIATAIAQRYTLVSADRQFSEYVQHGLTLWEVWKEN